MNEFKEIWEAFKQEWCEHDESGYLHWWNGKNGYYIDDNCYLHQSINGSDYVQVKSFPMTEEEAMMAAYLMETWGNE